ncbi:hypothetical protein CLV24_10860 [Pontibacter ummariensis]|uniref:Chain length determinant protein n=1 Tax=Pontibacter ummariensis TaxID=1610492 RepID=A0A239FCH8_9BACT|nr:chain length determinant protein [Pontibacter ummariensis]PRY12317.1 hypothetical protein CLV24_10860 [Pontibacter ummariensis]SNS54619.1 hypothetical protein SAMN06296052_108125 [Pontibacter ummariensis]
MKVDQEEHKVTSQRRYSDEVDIREIFDSIGRSIKSLVGLIEYCFKVALRRFKLIAFFVLLGLGLGYGAYKVTKAYYASTMTLVLADIRNDFVEDQLSKLTVAVEEDNFLAVSDMLDVSEDAARQIKKMEFSNLDAEIVEEDSVLTGSPFRIELSLYDNSLFDTMEPALANYLENNRYFSKLKRIKQREMEGMIAKLESEIESIDSIKTTVSSPRGPVNGFVYGQPVDPTNLYRESVAMYRQKAELEAELDQLDNIQVVNGFAPRLKPTGPNLLKYLAVGGLVAFLIGLMVALNIENKKRKRLSY